ncbi:flavin reductase family protein [Siccirubricoccus sp. G192]|uniref:flavin reductase family protein n=1 Tax=Siccirubricoccus sp. G192 TaxID=2849651 RepID=UPI001C2CA2A1|nr:flavin reductase family protein [Siccirubricoccus sp. G192]MBV1798462.1 flavin reductase family protein [Siccirubricoccus sp. G192]
MFYDPNAGRDAHGLPHDPFKSCVIPRPIGWISSLSAEGVPNLAPFSFFNAVCWAPAMVIFACPGPDAEGNAKDSFLNVAATGEFVVNMATWAQREAVNLSSAECPPEVDEIALLGLETLPSVKVKPPRIAGSPIHLECLHHQTVLLPSKSRRRENAVVFGRVVGVHIDDAVLRDGRIDLALVRPIARLGYRDWAVVDSIFQQNPPSWPLDRPDEAGQTGNQP